MSLFMEEDFIALCCKYVLIFLIRKLDSKSVVKSMFFRGRFLDQFLFDSVYLNFRMKIHGHLLMICTACSVNDGFRFIVILLKWFIVILSSTENH